MTKYTQMKINVLLAAQIISGIGIVMISSYIIYMIANIVSLPTSGSENVFLGIIVLASAFIGFCIPGYVACGLGFFVSHKKYKELKEKAK